MPYAFNPFTGSLDYFPTPGAAGAGGNSGELQFNSAGVLAGSQDLTFGPEGLRTNLPFGYGATAYGEVTQETDKTTDVTLNTPCGRIITANSQLNSNATAVFTLNNAVLTPNDILLVTAQSGAYNANVTSVGSGSAQIALRNLAANPLSQAVRIAFAVVKIE